MPPIHSTTGTSPTASTTGAASTPIAVITAHGNMQTAVEALKAGAFDFVSKPVDLAVLRKLVNTALKLRREETPGVSSPGARPSEPSGSILDRLTGSSPAITHCKEMIRKLARSQAPVLVSGDSGSGKELAARVLHSSSVRENGPFVVLNAAAMAPDLGSLN